MRAGLPFAGVLEIGPYHLGKGNGIWRALASGPLPGAPPTSASRHIFSDLYGSYTLFCALRQVGSVHPLEGVELRRGEERDAHGPAATFAQSGHAREKNDDAIEDPDDVDRRDRQDQPARGRSEAEPENRRATEHENDSDGLHDQRVADAEKRSDRSGSGEHKHAAQAVHCAVDQQQCAQGRLRVKR
jgi:hypothetical protein